jgi:hypothetical protein
MNTTSPNRNRKQLEARRKQSGDQHVLPLGDTAEAPHRPHRISREDMQKLPPEVPESDEPTSR